jgi:hypothetical protein
MMVKASAASALFVAAGLLVGFAGPSPAMAAERDNTAVSASESATTDKSVKHGSRYWKKRYAYRKHEQVASKSVETKKASEREVADASGNTAAAMPEWLANANAQMMSTDAVSESAKDSAKDSAKSMSEAMSAKASTNLQAAADKPADAQAPAETAATAADQLNDSDRSLQESPSTSTQTVAMASVKPAAEAATLALSNDSSTLDKTSLIGKIFIGFGALLTMASAARMFLA